MDIYQIFHYYAIDNTAAIAFSTTMGLLDGYNIGYSQDLRDMFIGLAYVFYFSTLSMLLRIMPFVSAYFLLELVRRPFMPIDGYKTRISSTIYEVVRSKNLSSRMLCLCACKNIGIMALLTYPICMLQVRLVTTF